MADLTFGALADPIGEQLARLGLKIKADKLERIELQARSVSVCAVHGLITRSVADKAYDKIFKTIRAAIAEGESDDR